MKTSTVCSAADSVNSWGTEPDAEAKAEAKAVASASSARRMFCSFALAQSRCLEDLVSVVHRLKSSR